MNLRDSLFGSISLSPLSRRKMLSAAVVATVGLHRLTQPAWGADKERKGLLVRPTSLELLNTRSKIALELQGSLTIEEPDPEKDAKPREAEVKAKATLEYQETTAFENNLPIAAARSYIEAKTENWVSGSASTLELREECRETRTLVRKSLWEEYSVRNPMNQREQELLKSPVNTVALEMLLPNEAARPKIPWNIGVEEAKQIFNLESVEKSTLSATIEKVENGTATIALKGEVFGTANGVSTALSVDGNYQAKLASKCALVSWVGIVLKESRGISASEPGFTITARIRLIREEVDQKPLGSKADLAALLKQADRGEWLTEVESIPGRYSMLADRRWHVYIDGGEEAILRMVENNTVIAQCNITRPPMIDQGTQITLEAMQAEIQSGLGKSFQAFVQTSEKQTSNNLRLLRCVAQGELEQVPVQWIYSHVSDDSGRRLALIYTMGGNYVEAFGSSDEQMLGSLRFLEEASSVAKSPTPAPAPTEKVGTKPPVENKR